MKSFVDLNSGNEALAKMGLARLFVCPAPAFYSKTKRLRKTKFGVNVRRGRHNTSALDRHIFIILYRVLFGFSWTLAYTAAVAAVYGVPWLTGVFGFTTAGIAAGSIGAWMMSLYGGTVVVAVLQSIGAAGMGAVATGIVAAIGGTAGGTAAERLRRYINSASSKEKADFVEGMITCLVSRCGGNLDSYRAASALMVLRFEGIDAITDRKEKDGVIRCLDAIISLHAE